MTTAEATSTRSGAGPSSPGVSGAWLLRAAAIVAVAAGAMGVVVAPGVRGNAGERVVVLADRAASSLSTFLLLLLVALSLWGAVELVRARTLLPVFRVALIGASLGVVVLSAIGMRDRLPAPFAVVVCSAAAVGAIAGASAAVVTPHTRALAGVLLVLALAAIARLGAWEFATAASERASISLYGVSRGFSTAGVLLEASAQIVAVTW